MGKANSKNLLNTLPNVGLILSSRCPGGDCEEEKGEGGEGEESTRSLCPSQTGFGKTNFKKFH